MDFILEELYRAFGPDKVSAKERELLERERRFLDEAEGRLSVADFGRLWDITSDLGAIRAEESFALGYRLGARLTLTIFQVEHLRP